MTRPRTALALSVGLLLGLSLTALAPPRPALAAASDYPDLTDGHGFDAIGDGPTPGRDLSTAVFGLDPTLDRVDLYASVHATITSTLYLVYTVGTLSGGTCTTRFEIVARNDSGTALVRAPGSTTLPAAPADPRGTGDDFRAQAPESELVHDVVPTCGTAALESATGTVYDSVPLTMEATPVPEQSLDLDYSGVYQVPAGTRTIHATLADLTYCGCAGDYVDPAGVLYDGQWSLDLSAGVTATPSTLVVDALTDDISSSITTPPGLSTLTAHASAGNANTTATTFTIYSPGGPVTPATGDLTGHRVADDSSGVWFVNRHDAYVGIPHHGAPHCTAANSKPHGSRGCLTYEWDTATNLLQIGDWIGAPDRTPSGSHALRGVYFYGHLSCVDYASPKPGSRFTGTYSLSRGYDGEREGQYTITDDYRLTLRKDGSFELSRSTDGETYAHEKGSYRVGPHSTLQLASRTGKRTRHVSGTIGVALNRAGKPDAGQGLVLALTALTPGWHGAFTTPGAHASTTTTGSDATDTWTADRFTGGTTCR